MTVVAPDLTEQDEVVLMDGSMGRQLCLDGMPQDDLFRKVWSARALVDEKLHTMVVEAHCQYIEAGAKILVTNSYGVQPTYYRRIYGAEGTGEQDGLLEASKKSWESRMLEDA